MRRIFFIAIFLLVPAVLMAQTAESPCSKLTLQAPLVLANPGDSVEFYVEAKDPKDLEKVSFEWKVAGRSFKGQGFPRSQIPTTREDGNSNITAFVKISEKVSGCSALLSESAGIAPTMPDHTWWEFGTVLSSELKGMLDVFFTVLANNPTNEGVLELTFTAHQTTHQKRSRLNQIYNHILFRRFDLRRISFYVQNGEYERVRSARIPNGVKYDDIGIDESKVIKAEEFKAKIKSILVTK